MSLTQILPILAYLAAAIMILALATGRSLDAAWGWRLAAGLGAAFAIFSLITVGQEGILMFWLNHSQNLTGNQVWIDLVIAVSIGFALIVPRAKAVGMRPLPWGVAVLLSACVALLPMYARLLWLERQRGAAGSGE